MRWHQMLTERQAEILNYIVREHIDTALPVGSDTLVRKFGLGLSSATIRNEMARLEEAGYISHPHTSAGRIPSDKGYRYYVEVLMKEENIGLDRARTIRHQFHQSPGELDDRVHLAASILATAVSNLGVAIAPRARATRLKQVQLIGLHDQTALMVVVLPEGRVRQQTIAFAEPVTQDELTRIANALNEAYSGLTAAEMVRRPEGLATTPELDLVRGVLLAALSSDLAYDHAYLDGVRKLLQQPEFASSDRMLEMLDVLDEHSLPLALPLDQIDDHGISVIIGEENKHEALQHAGVVMGEYSGPGGMSGALGIIGPTRMEYARAIATVRYLSELMTELLERLYR
jgi:heat-inducible transcriptional repressor